MENNTESKENQQEITPIKVLVLANENSPAIPAFLFLKKNGFKVRIFNKLPDVISEISQNGADILMISWSLQNVDVIKVYNLLSESFKILCAVFAESTNVRDTSRMMRSGIPNAIYPPISGIGVLRRIKVMLSANKEKKKNPHNKKASNYTLVSNLKTIPSKTNWNQVDELEDHSKIFEGVVKEEKSEKYYYFKGPDKPDLDEKGKNWKTNLEEMLVFATEQQADEVFIDSIKNAIQFVEIAKGQLGPEFSVFEKNEDKYKDVNLNITRDDKGAAEYEYSLERNNQDKEYKLESNDIKNNLVTRDYNSVLAKSLKSVVEAIAQTDSSSSVKPIQEASKGVVNIIKSERFKGYLLCVNANNTTNAGLMDKVMAQLHEKMKEAGHPLEAVTESLMIELESFPVESWAIESAEFYIKANYNNEEVLFAYLPSAKLPGYSFSASDQLLSVKLSDLEPGRTLFDLFIYMPKNQKYINYLKKDSPLPETKMQKLAKYKHEIVFIRNTELSLFYAYSATHKFLRSIYNFLTKKKSA